VAVETGKELSMERRVTSHTEEEEMNQRRRLLMLARKGDLKAVDLLFELYQVRVFSGEALKKKKLPSFPVQNSTGSGGKGTGKSGKKLGKIPKPPSSEGATKSASAAPYEPKESRVSTQLAGKSKSSKSTTAKPKKGRSVSSPKATTKVGGIKKSATTGKAKQRPPHMATRSKKSKKK
jgi:hypothetical protein